MNLETLLTVAQALPGSVREIESRTGIARSTVHRALTELKTPIPRGFGMELDDAGQVIDWGLINPKKIQA